MKKPRSTVDCARLHGAIRLVMAEHPDWSNAQIEKALPAAAVSGYAITGVKAAIRKLNPRKKSHKPAAGKSGKPKKVKPARKSHSGGQPLTIQRLERLSRAVTALRSEGIKTYPAMLAVLNDIQRFRNG